MHQRNQILTPNESGELLGYICDQPQIRADFGVDIAELLGDPPPDSELGNAAPDGPQNGVKYLAAQENSQELYSVECEDLLAPSNSALDIPLAVSRFADVKAQHVNREIITLRKLGELICETHAGKKSDLPLLKLATFGENQTGSGSLRHDSNLSTISGIEGDYDDGLITPEAAAEMLRAANIAGLIYTTLSHTPDAPRWRVLCPISSDTSPTERNDLCARANGVLGGILAPESFTRSQAYYYGSTSDLAVEIYQVEGRSIDHADELPRLGKTQKIEQLDLSDLLGETRNPETDPTGLADCDWWEPEPDWARIKSALSTIKDASGRTTWFEIGAALHHGSSASEDGFKLWCRWSKRCPEKYDVRDQRRTWESFGQRAGDLIKIGTLYHHAKMVGWSGEFEKVSKTSCLSFLSPSECEAAPSRGYLIKGLFAPRDVGCIFGAPGAGKSLIAPFLGYMVAKGTEAFGMRTKQGGVFYVAAEDAHGMRGRVKALKMAHSDAPAFQLVEGVSDLLIEGSPDLAALKSAVQEQHPALIFVDTMAMAFPGLEENSAEGMGRVVAALRSLTEWGAAMVLIHHDTKAEGSTPRGHSLLNGALDVALHVKKDGEGIIRGKLTKNRNGTCDRDIAFRIATEDGGTDDDGDMITLPRCSEISGGDDLMPRLTRSEAGALDVLETQLRTKQSLGSDKIELNPSTIPIDDWRAACWGDNRVYSGDKRNSFNVAFKRACEGLSDKGVIQIVTENEQSKKCAKLCVIRDLQ